MASQPITSKLFEPLQIGRNKLAHRIVMAPLTRFRADDSHVQLSFVKDYYGQRAIYPGTLIITEATFISPQAGSYPNIPGIWNKDQIAEWKEVVDEVHKKGSFIWLQLWALGRAASADARKAEGLGDVISASDVPMAEGGTVPRPLNEDEIQAFIKDYAQAAKNAVEGAGFDGVEIHGANGYLLDQFLQDVSNKRTDKWGGSIENRARFGIEVVKSVVDAVGADRTGIRLSPWSTFQGMKMDDPVPQFNYFLNQIKPSKLAYIHLVESRISGNADVEATDKNQDFIDTWDNTSPILLAGGFKPDSAKRAVDEEFTSTDLGIVFGRYFISNPDLVGRLKHGIALSDYNRDTFYKPKSKDGYLDYPYSQELPKN